MAERPRALVTGASSGIGAATARRLAADGFEVWVAARRLARLEELAEDIGGRAFALDVTDAHAVAAVAGQIDRLDLLVNNAGGALGSDPVESGDVEQWRTMYETNVLGTVNVTRALLPALRAAPTATIVTVTSTAGDGVYENGGGYTAAKHAERAVVGTLRLELAGEPIRVMEIVPGMVATEEFSLTRFGGDQERADAVYAEVDRPLVAEDVAECIALTVSLPAHVNVDRLVVRPLAQAAQTKLIRGPIFPR